MLFDMQSPGISTRPIRLISGYSPFTQTFFDNVQVPKENLVGELNKGWTIAKYLLTHERNMIGGIGTQRQTPLSQLAIKSIGLASGKLAEGTLRADIARFEMDALAFALTMGRVMDEAKAGNETGAVSSMLKYYGTELNKRRAELAMSIAGSRRPEVRRPDAGGHCAGVAADQGEFDRGRHVGSAAQHHREERAAAAGSVNDCWGIRHVSGSDRRPTHVPRRGEALRRASARRSHSCANCATTPTRRASTAQCGKKWRRWAGPACSCRKSTAGQGSATSAPGLIAEEIGRNLSATPLLSTAVLAVTALLRGGSAAQKETLLPAIAGGDIDRRAGVRRAQSPRAAQHRDARCRRQRQVQAQRPQDSRARWPRRRPADRHCAYLGRRREPRRHHAVPDRRQGERRRTSRARRPSTITTPRRWSCATWR